MSLNPFGILTLPLLIIIFFFSPFGIVRKFNVTQVVLIEEKDIYFFFSNICCTLLVLKSIKRIA